jgi:hypothetical protein
MIINEVSSSDLPKSFLYSITWNNGQQTASADGQYYHRTNLNGRYKAKIINIQMTHQIVSNGTGRQSNVRVSLISKTLYVDYPERNDKNITGTFPQSYGDRPLQSIDFYVLAQTGQFYGPIDLGVICIESGYIDVSIKVAINTAYGFRQACVELELEPVDKQYSLTDLMKLPPGVEIPLYTRQIFIRTDGTVNNITMNGVKGGRYRMRVVQAYAVGNQNVGWDTLQGLIAISSPQFLITNSVSNMADATGRENTQPLNCFYIARPPQTGFYMDKFEVPIELMDKLQVSIYDIYSGFATFGLGIVLNVELYPYV